MVCGFVKFATFVVFAILASEYFGVAEDILAIFAIFAVSLEPPAFLVATLHS